MRWISRPYTKRVIPPLIIGIIVEGILPDNRKGNERKRLRENLLNYLEQIAKENDFHNLVLSTFDFNEQGHGSISRRGSGKLGLIWARGFWMEGL